MHKRQPTMKVKNRILRLISFLLLTVPLPVGAILLDCEINADRTYTCIEISASTSRTEAPEGKETYSAEYSRYIEEAKNSCVYEEPRRRLGGKTTGGTLRNEDLKAARAAYEQCISDKARALWRSNNPGGSTSPTGE
jgi:hypothetical protein